MSEIIPIMTLSIKNKPGDYHVFKNVRDMQGWIFRNTDLWKTSLTDVTICFQKQYGPADMPVVIHNERLYFKEHLFIFDIAISKDFFESLTAKSFNSMKIHTLPRSFLKTRKGDPGWINRIFMFIGLLRKQA
jgi:hypothetical protein